MMNQTVITRTFDSLADTAMWLSNLIGTEVESDGEITGIVESIAVITYQFLPAELGYPARSMVCTVVVNLSEVYNAIN